MSNPFAVPVSDDDLPHPSAAELARARRCSGCGGRIYVWPCLQCRIRVQNEARSRRASPSPTPSSPEISHASPQ